MPEELGQNRRLERITEIVDGGRLDALVSDFYVAREGRPSYPPLSMVKVLLLEQWYTLSDPQMEEALGDRLSFRRFVGVGLQDATPDHSTISRFRTALEERGLSEQLFAEVGRQLEGLGLVPKQGTLMDATLVEAQVKRPFMAAGGGAKSPTDPDADWSGGRRAHFRCKVHVGVDAGSGLVRKATLTTAKVYESVVADALVSGDEREVYGDRAYVSKRRREWLKAHGIADIIMHRSHKHQRELPAWQQMRNALIRPQRALVEKVFGSLKRSTATAGCGIGSWNGTPGRCGASSGLHLEKGCHPVAVACGTGEADHSHHLGPSTPTANTIPNVPIPHPFSTGWLPPGKFSQLFKGLLRGNDGGGLSSRLRGNDGIRVEQGRDACRSRR